MSIKVLFDHQKFSTQKYGGISRYFANIIHTIKHSPDYDYSLGVLTCNNHYIKGEKLALKSLGNVLSAPTRAYKINQLYSKRLIEQNNFDVLHPTYYDPYFLEKAKKPIVITIHDMTYERLPEYFWALDPLTYQKRLNIERADKIIAISETTKADLIRYSNVDPSKISIVYHGIDYDTTLQTTSVKNLPDNYILFVGDRSGYKNFYLFLNAFKQISSKYKEINVVLTGGGNLGIADIEFIKRLNLEKRVMHVNATDEELNFLYQNAITFVYPSLHEGFGLPILEAFMAKCSVILSDTDCFREIGSDAAVYFNPYQIDDLIATLEKVINDSGLRNLLVENGLKRLKDFPIKKSMDETLAIYKSLL